MAKKTIADLQDLKGKRVLVRVDFNVAIKPKVPTTRDEAVITDDTRIRAALPTINYLVGEGAKVILMSHLGRPKGQVVEGLRLDVVANRLGELLGKPVAKVDDCVGSEVENAIAVMNPGDVLVLENVRFHPEEESKDDNVRLPFAEKLAKLGDVYVNDAFGTAHRDHASTASIARFLKPAVAGFLMAREIETLGKALQNPDRPFIAILGGAKVSDKLKVIDNLIGKVDTLLIGGGMAYTFFKAKGYEIGKSLLDESMIGAVNDMMKKAENSTTKMVLPQDIVVAQTPEETAETRIVSPDQIPADWEGLDIGPKTIAAFTENIKAAKLVIWNGPVGLFEVPTFAQGTAGIADAMANTDAFTIIGGGDSAAAVTQMGYAKKMNFISTGGGASLEFLEGKPLPGVTVLDEK
ncbi:MAG TPA: phosphoglycerate kinase [Armatimonadota bacterium]|nr:phosphoglycerate kinase [Armatimonadota bacterium]